VVEGKHCDGSFFTSQQGIFDNATVAIDRLASAIIGKKPHQWQSCSRSNRIRNDTIKHYRHDDESDTEGHEKQVPKDFVALVSKTSYS